MAAGAVQGRAMPTQRERKYVQRAATVGASSERRCQRERNAREL
jgi:hypothetical protein